MIPHILPSAYFDPTIFEKEQEILFRNTWQLIGFRSDLEKNNDYICQKIGSRSIVVQNFRGKIKAFHNVCAHRHSLIHLSEKGNRPLRCPYHGWTYNSEGIPIGIPNKAQFEKDGSFDKEKFKLEEWHIGTVGQFVFVKKNDDGICLENFLGEAHQYLELISNGLGMKLDCNRFSIKANWKIVLENTLENYHVSLVHPETFNTIGTSGQDFRFDGLHSFWSAKLNEKTLKKWKRAEKFVATRPFQTNRYNHQLIFPNMTIATTFGLSFGIQIFSPVSPNETRFTGYSFSTKLEELSASEKMVVDAMNDSVVKFNRVVFNEDKEICEAVQLGTEESESKGILGELEKRVYEFQSAYNSLISQKI